MPTRGGEETKVIDSTACIGPYAISGKGIYYLTPRDKQFRSDINLYEFSTGTTRPILRIPTARKRSYLAVSPDGRMILYAQVDEDRGDLRLVENFR